MNLEDKKEMGVRIKECRQRAGLSQEKLAEMLEMKRTNVANYEAGRVVPPGSVLLELANIFDVTTDYLLGKSPTSSTNETNKNLTEKDEKDIAKRMEKFKEDLTKTDGLSFYGEPMSEEALESFLDAVEYTMRQTKRINKKYIPKKYREDKDKN
ncbi:helix-turn-helix domain-containing protein [Priestia filamentosa]|uniref:helix-turn-helix domain-containing protein n=1 Tax=Priestia filamentosa TaxID=1402861 RepID=UPI003981E8F2